MDHAETQRTEDALDAIFRFRNTLEACATGGSPEDGNLFYRQHRRVLLEDIELRPLVLNFVRRCDSLGQFWGFIKQEFKHYQERRDYLYEQFRPLVDYLESGHNTPGLAAITEILGSFDAEGVRAAWSKALARRNNDADGAITAARTLLETVCKHVLDDSGTPFPENADLPKLWGLTAEVVNLAPAQHQEKVFKEILGSCQSVVNSLGSLRNRIGDAHGQGRRPVKPKPRHAELAVNLAGTMAAFLVATWHDTRGDVAS